MNSGNTMEVTHFLKLRRSAIGEMPSTAGGEIFDDFGFTETVRAPYTNWGASPPEARDFIVSVENMG